MTCYMEHFVSCSFDDLVTSGGHSMVTSMIGNVEHFFSGNFNDLVTCGVPLVVTLMTW